MILIHMTSGATIQVDDSLQLRENKLAPKIDNPDIPGINYASGMVQVLAPENAVKADVQIFINPGEGE